MTASGRKMLRKALLERVGGIRRWSQAILAARLCVTQNAVSAWCRGISRPTSKHRLVLERELGIPAVSWLTKTERLAAGLPPVAGEVTEPVTGAA